MVHQDCEILRLASYVMVLNYNHEQMFIRQIMCTCLAMRYSWRQAYVYQMAFSLPPLCRWVSCSTTHSSVWWHTVALSPMSSSSTKMEGCNGHRELALNMLSWGCRMENLGEKPPSTCHTKCKGIVYITITNNDKGGLHFTCHMLFVVQCCYKVCCV